MLYSSESKNILQQVMINKSCAKNILAQVMNKSTKEYSRMRLSLKESMVKHEEMKYIVQL